MTDEPNPAAAMSNRETLLRNLEIVFGSPNKAGGPDDVATLQARYVVALGHVAGFLNASRAEGLALKFLELADAIGQLKNGTVADVVRPAQVGGEVVPIGKRG